ncbi:MAG: deoxyribodipyrimidine photo-lyase, partial [Flavobacteriales bacterium]
MKTQKPLLAVYCFDPKQYKRDRFGFKKTEKFRARFLIETIQELKENLDSLNIPLFVYHDEPETILPQLIKNHNIKQVYFQKEWTFEERVIIEGVEQNSPDSIEFISTYDQFLWHPDDLPY